MQGLLHHVELYVSDLKRSKAFYHWLLVERLGYEVLHEWDEGVSYGLGDTYIVLVQAEKDYLDAGYHRKRVGLNHLAFHADSRMFVDELTEELKEQGVPILYAERHPYAGGPRYYAVFFEDPDRIKLEVAVSS